MAYERKRPNPPKDAGLWITRREASAILGVSIRTLGRWQGVRVRTLRVGNGRSSSLFLHRDDVEKMRRAKIGRVQYETEASVLEALRVGKDTLDIVRDVRVPLDYIERVRDQDARLRGALVLDAASTRILRELLGVEQLGAPELIVLVRAVVERLEWIAGELVRERQSNDRKSSVDAVTPRLR